MPKPEIAIQLDSEKPIIADQNRIFLTNKKAFTVHRHCPKCNDSTAARKVIILSRPGQPGSAKRHNSDLTWIYMKSVLSFCPKEEFSTVTFTDERDSDKEVIDVIRNHVRFSKRIHRFCRIAEMTFMLIMPPMFFMDNESGVLNFLVISAYIAALLFTVWSMYLMGRILILSEKHSHN